MQVPRGGQTLSSQPFQNPPISDYLGGTDTAITADGERQETVREDLGVRDAAGLAVGERFSLTNRAEGCHDETHKRTWRETSPFSCIATTQGVFQMQSSI